METKTYRTVLAYIKDMIRGGRLAVGDRLPTERCLSSELSISRNTVRDAMRILESMGIVESRQGSGNYLSARMDQYLSESLQFLLLLSQLSYLEINQLRRAVELEACRLAMESRTDGQLAELAALLDRLENSSSSEQPAADQQFHHAILLASGNQLLILMMGALSDVCGSLISGLFSALSPKETAELMEMHRKILSGIREKNPEDCLAAVSRHYDIADQALIQWEKEKQKT